jgi:hypothetical protein
MKIEFFSTDFGKVLKYQISWKSVQWEPICSMRTDGQSDMTKLIGTFRNFVKAPKKHNINNMAQCSINHQDVLGKYLYFI